MILLVAILFCNFSNSDTTFWRWRGLEFMQVLLGFIQWHYCSFVGNPNPVCFLDCCKLLNCYLVLVVVWGSVSLVLGDSKLDLNLKKQKTPKKPKPPKQFLVPGVAGKSLKMNPKYPVTTILKYPLSILFLQVVIDDLTSLFWRFAMEFSNACSWQSRQIFVLLFTS